MTYYINPIWFYLMNVSNSLRSWCFAVSLIMIGICVVVAIYLFAYAIETNTATYNTLTSDDEKDDDQEQIKKTWKVLKKSIILGALFMLLSILLPSEKTCIEMMIASQVTHENVETVKEEVYTIIDYIENYDHHADMEDE